MKEFMKKNVLKIVILIIALSCIVGMLSACEPYVEEEGPIYGIREGESNEINKDHTTKDEAIDEVTDSITSLKKYLNTSGIKDTGYYFQVDFEIDTGNDYNFILKIQANMYTYPYEDEYGNIDLEALAIHNETIKKNDILIEWYDGISNEMLIGMYYDGINANSADPGNIMYLNIQGYKRYFQDFGDTVLYQQLIRLLTSITIDDLLGITGAGEDGGVAAIHNVLSIAITNNYKKVLNNEITSIFFNDVDLSAIQKNITAAIQELFSPFGDKIDPLTKKYLGFEFSQMSKTELQKIYTNIQVFTQPDNDGGENLMRSTYLDVTDGAAIVDNKSVPFTAHMGFIYGLRPSSSIKLDKENYKFFDDGDYEFVGNLYIPAANLNLDALIRTDVYDDNNEINNVFGEFRDIANGDLIIGTYYKYEKTFLDVEGLQHLYGGIHMEDIGLPKAYVAYYEEGDYDSHGNLITKKKGFNLANFLHKMNTWMNNSIVSLVDSILMPKAEKEKNNVLEVIMAKMTSTEKDPDDPLSVNTVALRLDINLVKDVLREGGYGTYTTRDLINMVNASMSITLDEIASILGIASAEVMVEKNWFRFTLDVDTNEITIQMFSDIGIDTTEEESKLLWQLDLTPTKVGEKVKIADVDFSDFKELGQIMTYSALMGGQFMFSNEETVDLSELLGAMMGDLSGKNTPYVLPDSAKLSFDAVFDQYIRGQFLANGRWTNKDRNAFALNVYCTTADNVTVNIFNVYANDASFKSTAANGDLMDQMLEEAYVSGYEIGKNYSVTEAKAVAWEQLVTETINSGDDEVLQMLTQMTSDLLKTYPDATITDINALAWDQRYAQKLGYVWVDFVCLRNRTDCQDIPKFKIREDIWLAAMSAYINGEPTYSTGVTEDDDLGLNIGVNKSDINFSIMSILSALMEDSYVVFQPEQIEITTSNETVQNLFGVDNLIGNITAEVGLVQRVYGVDEIEPEFATYYVGTFRDMTRCIANGNLSDESIDDAPRGPYTTKLHDTIRVRYVYEKEMELDGVTPTNREEYRDLKFDYDPESVAVVDNATLYFPEIYGEFMGRVRSYTIYMQGGIAEKALIKALANDLYFDETDMLKELPLYIFEPLEFEPMAISADKTMGSDITNLNRNFTTVVVSSNSEVIYNAHFLIDWDKVTVAGAYAGDPNKGINVETEVVIAEGFMGETRYNVRVIVINRQTEPDTFFPSQVDVSTEKDSESLTVAPVVGEIAIDPYDYALKKAEYFELMFNYDKYAGDEDAYAIAYTEMEKEFVAHYFASFEVYVAFEDFDNEIIDTRDTIRFVINPNAETIDNLRAILIEDIREGLLSETISNIYSYPAATIVRIYNENRHNALKIMSNYSEGEKFSYGYFDWQFDQNQNVIYYKENDVTPTGGTTYLHTYFRGQWVALKVVVESRTIDYIIFDEYGETEPDYYMVDVLDSSTYSIPTNPTVVFVEKDPSTNNGYTRVFPFKLNWSNPRATNIKMEGSYEENDLKKYLITEMQKLVSIGTLRDQITEVEAKMLAFDDMLAFDGYLVEGRNLAKVKDKATSYLIRNGVLRTKDVAFDNLLSDMTIASETEETLAYIEYMNERKNYYSSSTYLNLCRDAYKTQAMTDILNDPIYRSHGQQFYVEGGITTKAEAFDKLLNYFAINDDENQTGTKAMYEFLSDAVIALKTANVDEIKDRIRSILAENMVVSMRRVAVDIDEPIVFGNFQNEILNAVDDSAVDLFCDMLFEASRDNSFLMNELKKLISSTIYASPNIENDKTVYINRPFLGYDTAKTSSYISMKNYLNGDADWFVDYIVTVTVECPAKEIPNLEVVEQGYVDMASWDADANATPPTEDNMVDLTLSNVKVGSTTARGYYFVDPFDLSTVVLPTSLTITFLRRPNGTETYERTYEMTNGGTGSYTLQWIVDELNPANDFIKLRDDNVYVLDITKLDANNVLALIDRVDGKKEVHLKIMAKIGNSQIGYKEVSIVVRILTANYSKVLFYYGELGDFENSRNLDDMIAKNESTTDVRYSYDVDTYQGFDVPSWFVTVFGADSRRLQLLGYKSTPVSLPLRGEDGDAWLVKNEVYSWDGSKGSWEIVGVLNGFANASLIDLGGIVPIVNESGMWCLGTTNVGYFSEYDSGYNLVSGYRVLKYNQDESWLKVVNLGINSGFGSEQHFVVDSTGRWKRFVDNTTDESYSFSLGVDVNGCYTVNGDSASSVVLILENTLGYSAYASEYADRRIYASNWVGPLDPSTNHGSSIPAFTAGISVPLITTLGAGNITMGINLTINVYSRTPILNSDGHIFINIPMIWDEDSLSWKRLSFSVSMTPSGNNIVLNDLILNSEGRIENLGFGRGHYDDKYYPDSYTEVLDPQKLVAMYPYELFEKIFSEIYLIFPDSDRDDMDITLQAERSSISAILISSGNNKDRAYDSLISEYQTGSPLFVAEVIAKMQEYLASGIGSEAVAKAKAWDYAYENISGRALEKLIIQYKRATSTQARGNEMEAAYEARVAAGESIPLTKTWEDFYVNTVSYTYENTIFAGRDYSWNFVKSTEINNFEGLFSLQDIMTELTAEASIRTRFDYYVGEGAGAYDFILKLVVRNGIKVTSGITSEMSLIENSVMINLYDNEGTALLGADGYVLGKQFSIGLYAEYGMSNKKYYTLYYGPNYDLFDFDGRAVYTYTDREGKSTNYYYDETRREVYGYLPNGAPVYYDLSATNQISYYVYNNGEKDYSGAYVELKNAIKQEAYSLDRWYVEESNTNLIPVGSFISTLPSALLYSNKNLLLTLSTLTPLGLRIRSKFTVQSVSFGNSYTGRNNDFEIGENATILIEDLYDFWPLTDTLRTNENLPTTVSRAVEGKYNITISGVEWKIDPDWYNVGYYDAEGRWIAERGRLLSIDYTGISRTLIATAEILGWYDYEYDDEGRIVYDIVSGQPKKIRKNSETISLYMRIDPAIVRTLPLDSLGLETYPLTVVESVELSPTVAATQTIFLDAYTNANYGGIFTLPSNLSIKYTNGIVHTFASVTYKYNGLVISRIPYNVNGIETLTNGEGKSYFKTVFEETEYVLSGANTKYEVNLTADIGAGQILKIKVHFYNKEVLAINPVLKYNDSAIRNQIYNSMSNELEQLKNDLEGTVNVANMVYWIDAILDKNKAISEAPDMNGFYNFLRSIPRTSLVGVGDERPAAFEQIRTNFLSESFGFIPTKYPIANTEEKQAYNYAADRVISLYDEDRVETFVLALIEALLAYADRAETGATFMSVETLTKNIVNTVYNEALLKDIHDRIIDTVLGDGGDDKLYNVVNRQPSGTQEYLLAYKNLLQEEINIDEIYFLYRRIEDLSSSGRKEKLKDIFIDEFFAAQSRLMISSSISLEVKDSVFTYLLTTLYGPGMVSENMLDEIVDAVVGASSSDRIQDVISNGIENWFISTATVPLKINPINEAANEFAPYITINDIRVSNDRMVKYLMSYFYFDKESDEPFDKSYSFNELKLLALEDIIGNAISDLVLAIGDFYQAGSEYFTQASRAVRFAISDSVDDFIREGKTIAAINKAKLRTSNHNAGKASGSAYQIDPYGDYIFVPDLVEFIFSGDNGGENYYQKVNWNLPTSWKNTYTGSVTYEGNDKGSIVAGESAWSYFSDSRNAGYAIALAYQVGNETLYEVMGSVATTVNAAVVGATQVAYLEQNGVSYAEDTSAIEDKKVRMWWALVATYASDPEIQYLLPEIIEYMLEKYPELATTNAQGVTSPTEEIYEKAYDFYLSVENWNGLKTYMANNSHSVAEKMLIREEDKHRYDYFTAALAKTNLTTQTVDLIVIVDDRTVPVGTADCLLVEEYLVDNTIYDYSSDFTGSILFKLWSNEQWTGPYSYDISNTRWSYSGDSSPNEPENETLVGQLIYSVKKEEGRTPVLSEVIFYVNDPFVCKVENFPSKIKLSSDSINLGQTAIEELSIDWLYDDRQISYLGSVVEDKETKKYGKLINGYIKNINVGQMISMRVVTSQWDYNGIRQYSEETGNYNIMSPVNFIFSKLVDYSANEQYQVMFRTKTYSPVVTITESEGKSIEMLREAILEDQPVERFFYPEDSILIGNYINDVDMEKSVKRRNYILYWDVAALARASDGSEVKGNFSFGNEHKNLLTQNNAAIYKYETSYIEKLRFMNITVEDIMQWIASRQEGLSEESIRAAAEDIYAEYEGYFGATGVVAVVLNPYSADLEAFAEAIGTLNQRQGQDLGDVRILWSADFVATTSALSLYLRENYPELDATSALERAQEIIMGNYMTDAEKAELLTDLMEYRLSKIKTELSLEELTSESLVWEALLSSYKENNKAAYNELTTIAERIFYENQKAKTNNEKEYQWKMIYRVLSLNELPKITDNIEKVEAWNAVEDRVSATGDVYLRTLMNALKNEIFAALVPEPSDTTETLTEKAKAAAYDIYAKYLLWNELLYPEDSIDSLSGTVVNELEVYLEKLADSFPTYNKLRLIAMAFDLKLNYYEGYTAAELDELINTAIMDKVTAWNDVFNRKGSLERRELEALLTECSQSEDVNKNKAEAYDIYLNSLLWDEFFNLSTEEVRNSLRTCLDRIISLNEGLTTYKQKSEALSVCMLMTPDSATAEFAYNIQMKNLTLIDNFENNWNNTYASLNQSEALSQLIKEISVLYGAYQTKEIKAICYDAYSNATKWDTAMSGADAATRSRMLNVVSDMTDKYGSISTFRIKSLAWKVYNGIYEDEQIASVSVANRYIDKETQASKAFTSLLNELSLREYLKAYAKELISADEVYDFGDNLDYLSGGINAGKKVTVLMQLERGGFIYTQEYTVRVIFFDTTPTDYFQRKMYLDENDDVVWEYEELNSMTSSTICEELYFAVKNVYKPTDYDINGNPYDNFTQFVFDSLDIKALEKLSIESVLSENYSLIKAENIVWDYSTVKDGRVKSKSFMVNGRIYYSDILELGISE